MFTYKHARETRNTVESDNFIYVRKIQLSFRQEILPSAEQQNVISIICRADNTSFYTGQWTYIGLRCYEYVSNVECRLINFRLAINNFWISFLCCVCTLFPGDERNELLWFCEGNICISKIATSMAHILPLSLSVLL